MLNNYDSIYDEIWENIDYSKLIICDFTNFRPNCFIEYGYAYAKEKNIILTIEKTFWENEHKKIIAPSDTLMQKYSMWKKEWLEDDNYKDELTKFKEEIKDRIIRKISIIESHSEI